MRGDGGQVIMINGTEIEVSRRKKEDLLQNHRYHIVKKNLKYFIYCFKSALFIAFLSNYFVNKSCI